MTDRSPRGAATALSFLALVTLTGCATASDDTDPTACAPVGRPALDQIASRVTSAVADDFALPDGSVVPAEEHGSGYIVAARIEAKGIETGFGYWWVSEPDGNASTVLWAAPFADQFTTWPAADTLDPPVDPDGADVAAARVCLGGG